MTAGTAFSIWGEALAESKAAPAPALNPAARSFHLPSSAPMDPASSPFCPEKKVLALAATVIKASSVPDDEIEDSSLQRSSWKQAKGAPCRVAKTPAGNVVPRTQRTGSRVSAVRPPTPPRTRSSHGIKRAPEKISKNAAPPVPSHLKKHLDVLQSLPLVRSGLSDLLDGLAVLPSAESAILPTGVSA